MGDGLDAFVDGGEHVVDLAEVNGRNSAARPVDHVAAASPYAGIPESTADAVGELIRLTLRGRSTAGWSPEPTRRVSRRNRR